MSTFENFMVYLDQIGVADVLLPFILIFTIIFAILQKTKIFGETKDGKAHRNFDTVVALVMGLAVVIPHVMGRYPPGADIVEIMNNALPNISLIIVAILMLLLIIGIFGHDINLAGSPIGGWFVILAILIVGFIFGRAAGWFQGPGWLGFLDDPETQTLVVIILVFGIIVWFVTKDDTPKDKEQGLADNFRKLLGGKQPGG
ncbi:MAG: hypothetical protein ABIJ21_02380 [Nanoarchaeota archaeon]